LDSYVICSLFFFNDTATTEIYTLSLHDALPIYAFFSYDLGSLKIDLILECDVKPVRLAILGLGTVGGGALKLLKENAAEIRRRRSEEHTSELQSRENLVCRLLLEKKKKKKACIN